MNCIYCKENPVQEIMQDNLVFYYCSECNKKSAQALEVGGKYVQKKADDGRVKHVSVGAIIERNGEYLLCKRRVFEFGYANIAGHLEYGETPEEAIRREVFEETGMKAKKVELFFHDDVDGDKCKRGVNIHEYYYYKVQCLGTPVKNNESELLGWYTPEQIAELNLVFIARFIYKELGIIDA